MIEEDTVKLSIDELEYVVAALRMAYKTGFDPREDDSIQYSPYEIYHRFNNNLSERSIKEIKND